MIPAIADGQARSITLDMVRGILPSGVPGRLLVKLDRAEYVIVKADDMARYLAPQLTAPAPVVAKRSAPAKTASPGATTGHYGAFYKACQAAEYVLCSTCKAYRFADHADCGPDYLYRDMGMGHYRADTVRVELRGGLDGEPDHRVTYDALNREITRAYLDEEIAA